MMNGASFSTIMAVPDFVAGLLYELTGDSNLPELQQCYEGGDLVITKAAQIFANLEDGNLLRAVKYVQQLVEEVQAEAVDCKNMSDDFAAIEAWLARVTHPVHLAENVGKNYLLNHKQIKADIAAEKADWSNGNFFQAGKDTADAIVYLLGPIEEVKTYSAIESGVANFDVLAVPEFVAGIMYGFTGDNNLPEIEVCYHGSKTIESDAVKVLHDLEGLDFFHSLRDGKKFMNDIHGALSNCEGMEDDLARLAAWGSIFTEPVHLAEAVGKNWLYHHGEFNDDLKREKIDWDNKEYFNAGVDVADALVVLLGPVQ